MDSSTPLAIIAITVIADGMSNVNPAERYMQNAQTTSSRPATNRINQYMVSVLADLRPSIRREGTK